MKDPFPSDDGNYHSWPSREEGASGSGVKRPFTCPLYDLEGNPVIGLLPYGSSSFLLHRPLVGSVSVGCVFRLTAFFRIPVGFGFPQANRQGAADIDHTSA